MAKRVGANRRQKRAASRSAARAHVKRGGRRFLTVSKFGVAAAVLLSGGLYGVSKAREWFVTSPVFRIESVKVRGVRRVGRDELLAACGIAPDMHMSALHVDEVKESIVRRPWIKKVSVWRWFPDKVLISITEREPIALVNVGDIWQMDREGVLMPMRPGEYLDLPVVSGVRDTTIDGERVMRSDDVQYFLRFREAVQSVEKRWWQRVTQVGFSDSTRIRLALEGYSAVITIDRNDVPQRMNQLWHLLARLRTEGDGAPRTIDIYRHNLAYVGR